MKDLTQEDCDRLSDEIKTEMGASTVTCDKCDARFKCHSAYNAYNTDGDCLESK